MNGHDDDQVARRPGRATAARRRPGLYRVHGAGPGVRTTRPDHAGERAGGGHLGATVPALPRRLPPGSTRPPHPAALPRPGRAANATLTGAGHAKVAAAAPGHLQAVCDDLIGILAPGGL